jgi:ribose 1,5-bisphosphokinase PhnN
MATQYAGEQPGEGGKQCPVGPAGAGRDDLTAQHRHLMTQDQYLDVLGSRGSRPQHQPREDAGDEQVEHPHKHEPRSCRTQR